MGINNSDLTESAGVFNVSGNCDSSVDTIGDRIDGILEQKPIKSELNDFMVANSQILATKSGLQSIIICRLFIDKLQDGELDKKGKLYIKSGERNVYLLRFFDKLHNIHGITIDAASENLFKLSGDASINGYYEDYESLKKELSAIGFMLDGFDETTDSGINDCFSYGIKKDSTTA